MLQTIGLSFGQAIGTGVGLLFLMAAAGKLRHRDELSAIVANYRLLPQVAVRPVASVLPWLEGLLGLLLVAGGSLAGFAAWPAAALLLAFAFAMQVNIRRGRSHIDCGCGLGGLRQPLRGAFVRRNVGLAVALLPLALLPATLTGPEHVVASAAGLSLFGLLLLLNSLQAIPSQSATGA